MAGKSGLLNRRDECILNIYFEDIRIEYTTIDAKDLILYQGKHFTHDAPTSDENWIIFKSTFSGTNTVRIEKLVGPWDDRATLDWGV